MQDKDKTREQLITELEWFREQLEQASHLASFPQLNPNPILEVDQSCSITFYNTATIKTLDGEVGFRQVLLKPFSLRT